MKTAFITMISINTVQIVLKEGFVEIRKAFQIVEGAAQNGAWVVVFMFRDLGHF